MRIKGKQVIYIGCEELIDLLRGRGTNVDDIELRLTAEAECAVYEIVEDMKHDDRIDKAEQKYWIEDPEETR